MGLFRKKEEKKKFDYSDDTKELFAERDAFYAEQRRKLGGGDTNPELANQQTSKEERPKEDLEDLLGDSDFNPYANKEEVGGGSDSIAAPSAPSSNSSAFVCQSCGKDFQEKWGKCPSCGGEMKKAESQTTPEPAYSPVSEPVSNSNTNAGDPLDDLLGDFGSGTTDDSSDNTDETPSSNIRNSGDDLGTDFGSSRSSHSNRKIRKVKRVKRSRKQL